MEKSIRREATLERSFCNWLRKAGCLVYKFVSPGNDGVPDRIVVTSGGRVIFVELKTERGELSDIQNYQIGRIRDHGQDVRELYGKDDVDRFVLDVQEGRI